MSIEQVFVYYSGEGQAREGKRCMMEAEKAMYDTVSGQSGAGESSGACAGQVREAFTRMPEAEEEALRVMRIFFESGGNGGGYLRLAMRRMRRPTGAIEG